MGVVHKVYNLTRREHFDLDKGASLERAWALARVLCFRWSSDGISPDHIIVLSDNHAGERMAYEEQQDDLDREVGGINPAGPSRDITDDALREYPLPKPSGGM